MHVVDLLAGFSAKDMILELADSLKFNTVEFGLYMPESDGYGVPPRAVGVYSVEDFRALGVEAVKQELLERPCIKSVDEAVRSELPEVGKDLFALGLSSRVIAGNTEFHLPQIDFGVDTSETNLRKLYEYIDQIGQHDGYVVESGRSYHFQGADLMPREFWMRYMDSLDDNIVDGQWAVESVCTRGFSLLRLTSTYSKPMTPRIVSRTYSDPKLLFEN